MSIVQKVKSVERLFDRLDREIIEFNSHTKLHCVAGCGRCCTKPDIDASPLEFLPWSFHLFLTGQAEKVLDKLNKKDTNSVCHLFQPLSITDNNSGRCSDYHYRGLICRLFGSGASRDKLGQLRLATCKLIKEGQKENYDNAVVGISQGLPVPIFTDYYMNLAQIDFRLGNTMLPINEAMRIALEEVLHYYAYRPSPRGFKGAA